ncbi:hypothetical protein [Paraliomyxa miuraensis]|uniref:hypothetical protein n=1 Tax=Paraliomyxa miuraensis TaxID=376150 RepID=UPI002258EC44|nr:hypothetical protein [Paraliomyxa miuraensis]MCX4243187.1 hypothetical protein [Paraliomyxa miuraensis]
MAALVSRLVPLAGCNDYPTVDGSQGTGTTTQGSMSAAGNASAMDGTAGTDAPVATTGKPPSDGSTSTSGSVGTASDTTDDTGPPSYPEECYEPEAFIDVMSAITPDGPLTIGEAWLGVDACTHLPYVVLVQYPSPETGPAVEVTLMLRPEEELPLEEYFGVHPLALSFFGSEPIGTFDVLEPMDGSNLGMPDGNRHLHARIEAHEAGWDLSLEVDLLDCGAGECFCPCE